MVLQLDFQDRPRCVISGIGAVSPLGHGVSGFWSAVLEGRSGIGYLTRFSPSPGNCSLAGEVDSEILRLSLDARTLRTTTHATQLALIAATEGVQDAAIGAEYYSAHDVGVFVGTAVGGWVQGEQQFGVLVEKGAQRLNPFLASGAPTYSTGAEVAHIAEASGPQYTYSSGCPSSLQAIGGAALSILGGETQMCLTGGTESPLVLSLSDPSREAGSCPTSRVQIMHHGLSTEGIAV